MDAVVIEVDDTGALRVALRGEVDFTSAPRMTAAIRQAVADRRPGAVHVDLAEVSFLDSSGIGVLVDVMKAAGQAGAPFVVEHARGMVYDQLSIAGLIEAFRMSRPPADA